jgi:sialic acid synthase SpsE/mannose-6-phosphate isomerase-like protein (cupin superfamily)
MISEIPSPLIILEMANNHMGDIEHGLNIIRTYGKVCKKYPFNFAFKLQYRNLDTFIHPEMLARNDIHYIKRFSETRLSNSNFNRLIEEMRLQGFITMATPFDEVSVDLIESQSLDIIKIASCSFTDWPLLERVVKSQQPIIASTAGATLDEIDSVISFLQHRKKQFAIMHCVGEYPTPDDHMNISQIDFFKARYPNVRVGLSTHENPANIDIIKMTIAKGVTLFEKHVGIETASYPLNAYSASPDQLDLWLTAAQYAQSVCGEGSTRYLGTNKESESLHSLRRGAFAKRPIKKGEALNNENIYFAFPPRNGQYTANDWSKYSIFVAAEDIQLNQAISPENTQKEESRQKILDIVKRVNHFLKESHVVVPGGADLDISHHYGLERFDEVGLTLITVVNRGYCKKLLVTLPGQQHPEQVHKQKEETFHVLYGMVALKLNDVLRMCHPGDVVTIEPGTRHSWVSDTGAVIEELSTTHFINDSFYTDEAIMANTQRKTSLTYWMET